MPKVKWHKLQDRVAKNPCQYRVGITTNFKQRMANYDSQTNSKKTVYSFRTKNMNDPLKKLPQKHKYNTQTVSNGTAKPGFVYARNMGTCNKKKVKTMSKAKKGKT